MVIKSKKNGKNRDTLKQLMLLTLGAICFSVALVTIIEDPILFVLKKFTSVTNGSFVTMMMSKDLEGVHLSAYLFNITNADQFISGEDQKLRVQEVGPFTYKEVRRFEDLELDYESQIMRCIPRLQISFVPEESIGNPENVTLLMPNLPMLGLSSTLSSYPYWTRVTFNMVTKRLDSKPLISIDAHSYLWGYEEQLITIAHTIMPSAVGYDKIGILDRIYEQDVDHRVEASIADDDKFMVKKINGYSRLKMSSFDDPDTCEQCNTLENVYEGIGYRSGLDSSFPIRLLRHGICRILDMEYHGRKMMDFGGEALVYHFSDKFFSLENNETNDGVLELSDCYFGIPFAITKAHFLDLDPKLYEKIDGIKPDEKYRGWISVEPKIGMQVETQFSMQLNLKIQDVSHSEDMKSFSNMIIPIAYVTIVQPPLPQETTSILHSVYVTGPYALIALRILLIFTALISWTHFLYIRYDWKFSRKLLRNVDHEMSNSKREADKQEPLMTIR